MNRFPCHKKLLFIFIVLLCRSAVMTGEVRDEMMNSITKENGLAGVS